MTAAAHAGEYTSVEIGHTGEHLRNSAPHQLKHYTWHTDDLCARIECLMQDVDDLLARLHALPPETVDTDPVVEPADSELGWLYNVGLRYNPELAKPRSELAVLAAQTRQAGSVQDPMLSFELMDIEAPIGPIMGSAMDLGFGVSFTRMFESYGKRGLRRSIASREEQLKELELAQMEVDHMFEITEEYYDLFGMVARMRSLEDNIELLQILLEIANQRLAIGTTSQAEVLNAQVQLSRLELMRTELRAMTDQSYNMLAGMLGNCSWLDLKERLKFDAAYPLPPQIEWDNQTFLIAALDRYPAYQRVKLMDEQQDLEVEMARRDYHPDYQIMGRYEAGIGFGDTYSVEVEIPLFLNKEEKQDARLQEMYAEKAVISDEGNSIANEYITRIKNLQVEMRMHSELVDLMRLGTVPQARFALESSIAAYAAGSSLGGGSASSSTGGTSGMAGPPAIGEGENTSDSGAGANLDTGVGSPSMGSGMPGGTFNTVLLAQQALLSQEQDLEQNYIHILHVFADLQVLTLGAFDPKDYMVSALEPVQAATQPIVIVPTDTEDLAPAMPRSEFIESLDLPVQTAEDEAPRSSDEPPGSFSESANSDPGWATSFGPVSEEEEEPELGEVDPEVSESDGPSEPADSSAMETSPQDSFYEPFDPTGDTDG